MGWNKSTFGSIKERKNNLLNELSELKKRTTVNNNVDLAEEIKIRDELSQVFKRGGSDVGSKS